MNSVFRIITLGELLIFNFEEKPMELISSAMFKMLFDHWNVKFVESLNDPVYCCRAALMKTMSKSYNLVLSRIRTSRYRHRIKMKTLTEEGKVDSSEWKRIETLDKLDEEKQNKIHQIRAKQKSLKG